MTSSQDRYTKPADGEDPRDIDREFSDAEVVARRTAERQVSHPQEREGEQGTSADSPGFDAADRDRVDDTAEEGVVGAGEPVQEGPPG
jgi:hypothetical protein